MGKFIFATIKWVIAFVVTLPVKHSKRFGNLMLVSERGDDARDNGYHFFIHVKEHHPEVDVRYVITDDSPDRDRLAAYEDSLVRYMSFRHCVLFWKARYLVGTHLRAGHTPLPFVVVKWMNRVVNIYRGKKIVNLKHGIVKNFIERMMYEDTHYNLLVCGAAPERAYFVEKYHYPDTVARYTGLCRFDKLMDFQVKRQILVMPTWRNYLDPDKLTESLFYRLYMSFLKDKRLTEMLERYDIDLIFYLHHRFQSVYETFKGGLSQRITVADQAHYDVQQLLKDSAVMITDYSSVLFDFVYMKKPVMFFQFDKEEFLSKHYKKGYVNEEYFGPVAADVESLIESLKKCLDGGLHLDAMYEERINAFFPLRDTHNCDRVFDAVMHC